MTLRGIADSNHVSMFDVGADILINPVNCIGIMGGGLALEFKLRFPNMFKDYQEVCATGFHVGMLHTYQEGGKIIFNVPTKSDLSDSTKTIIKASLAGLYVSLVAMRPFLAGATIAMPALGCGLGNMEWEGEDGVKDMLVRFCQQPLLDEYQFLLFTPKG
jgi:O-acetyl-ADP-ribose deacetylase (regulator of RNase III)